MTDQQHASMGDKYRMERIERLLHELRYEITRGMLESEIDESIGYTFNVPLSKSIPNGVVRCEFRTRPVPSWQVLPGDVAGRLRIVK